MEIRIKANEQLADALETEERYLAMYGGAGSGKSYIAIQKHLIRIINEQDHRFLFIRKFKTDIRESVFKLAKDVASDMEVSFIENKTYQTLTFDHSNSEIITAGLDDVDRLKSIAGITGIFIEEADQLDKGDLDQLDLRLRGETANYKQIVLCWNPVSEEHWLKEFIETADDCKVLHSTYKNNRFLDDEYIELLEKRMKSDDNMYRIYVLGEWGVVQTGQEWANSFSREAHVRPVEYDDTLHCHLALDQNYQPYATGLVSQMEKKDDILEIRFIDEICLPPPANSTEQLCQEYVTRGYRTPYFYGDASGGNARQRTTTAESRDHYEVVESYFKNPDMNRVIRKNPPRAPRRRFWNRLLSGYYPVRIIIDPKCKNLIGDLEKLQTDADGCYLKPKVKDKTTGVTYESLGHCVDSATYEFYWLFEDWFREV